MTVDDNKHVSDYSKKHAEFQRQEVLKLLTDISASLKTLVFYGASKTTGGHASARAEKGFATTYLKEDSKLKTIIKEDVLKRIKLKES